LGAVLVATASGWTPVGTAPNIYGLRKAQVFPNTSIVGDPIFPNLVYVSGDEGTANTNGDVFVGNLNDGSWNSLANANANGTAPHSDSRSMAFDHNGSLLETNDGGIYRLVNVYNIIPTIPRSWGSANGNLRITEFYSVAYDSHNEMIFGGATRQIVGTSRLPVLLAH